MKIVYIGDMYGVSTESGTLCLRGKETEVKDEEAKKLLKREDFKKGKEKKGGKS